MAQNLERMIATNFTDAVAEMIYAENTEDAGNNTIQRAPQVVKAYAAMLPPPQDKTNRTVATV